MHTKDILYSIGKEIECHKTFHNFALCNKNTAIVSKQLKDEKFIQFGLIYYDNSSDEVEFFWNGKYTRGYKINSNNFILWFKTPYVKTFCHSNFKEEDMKLKKQLLDPDCKYPKKEGSVKSSLDVIINGLENDNYMIYRYDGKRIPLLLKESNILFCGNIYTGGGVWIFETDDILQSTIKELKRVALKTDILRSNILQSTIDEFIRNIKELKMK